MTILDFQQVSFVRDKNYLLKAINWQVKKNEHWAILGLNGAGKSLLLQMITGSLWPSSGQRTVLGERYGKTSVPDLQRRIGWVSSALQSKFYGRDLAEEIVLSGLYSSIGLYASYEEEQLIQAKKLLADLGLSHLIHRSYHVLSQGEKQFVMIARAMMAQPEILILDEPCTGLDLFAREELLTRLQAFSQLPNTPTLLYVTHHTEELLPIFTHLLMLKNGKVHAAGQRETIFTEEVLTSFYDQPIILQPFSSNRVIVTPK